MRAQRKPREMVQKVSKAQHCRGELGLFSCLSPFQGMHSQTWVWLFLFKVGARVFSFVFPRHPVPCHQLCPTSRISFLDQWPLRMAQAPPCPEMSLYFLQMAMQWFGSKQVKLSNAAITLCCSVRFQGIPDLSLSLANSLLAVVHTDMRRQVRLIALDMLKNCQATYPHSNV